MEVDVVPFSFGNGIFLNQNLHSPDEIPEIIKHEFVHVEQKHTIDVLFSEFLCMLLWYNPFVWLLRLAMRQNLEYIADNFVLEKGTDKKNYQYLLLKVMSDQPISITNPFNFSSLKNRIIMMNKIKSARVNLVKFLFALPLLAFLLLAFRNQETIVRITSFSPSTDTIPKKSSNTSKNDLAPKRAESGETIKVSGTNPFTMTYDGKKMTVKPKNGKTEIYDMNKPADEDKFQEKYGFLPTSGGTITITGVSSSNDAVREVTVNGFRSESLAKIVNDDENATVVETPAKVSSPVVIASGSNSNVIANADNNVSVAGLASPAKESTIALSPIASDNISTTGEVILDLTKKMTSQDLDKKIAELKSKGFSFQLKNSEFKDGSLVSLDAEISYKDDVKSFKVHDFVEMIITSQKTDDKSALFRFYVVKGSLTVH